MAFALECQADIKHEELDDDLEDGNHWSRLWSHMFKHLAPRVKSNLRTNKSMRQGFVNFLLYIAAKICKPNEFQSHTTSSLFSAMRLNGLLV